MFGGIVHAPTHTFNDLQDKPFTDFSCLASSLIEYTFKLVFRTLKISLVGLRGRSYFIKRQRLERRELSIAFTC